jgi:MFS family permease
MSSATYRTLLRAPGAAAFFLTAAVGRTGIAMTGLGIIWLVHARTGSYATAGLVTGGFAVAEAVTGPQLARLIDRVGQSRVLPPALLAHAAAVATLLALVSAGAPDWLMMVGGVLAGATIPQLGALSAARWTALLGDERAPLLPTAFALESLANEVAFLAGPALVSILGASGYPEAGTVLAATLVVAGGLCFAAQRRTAPPASGAAGRHHPGHHPGRTLLRPGFAVLVGVTLAIGVFFGAMQISVTAFAVEHGAPGAAAVLFTVSSCASLLAGWLYGLRRWQTAARVQLAVVVAALAVGCLPLLAARSPVELGCGVALTGLAIPPILVLCSLLAESAVRRAVLTQAFVWLNSASAAGSAGAAAVTGWAVTTSGAHGGFTVAATATAVAALLAVTGLRALPSTQRLRPSAHHSVDLPVSPASGSGRHSSTRTSPGSTRSMPAKKRSICSRSRPMYCCCAMRFTMS